MRVAIIEDQQEDLNHLLDCINKLFKEQSIVCDIDSFEHVENFDFNKIYDLIFLDIIVHDRNGFEFSKRIRDKFDSNTTTLVFCTTLSQYAIEGYSVGAATYVLKPYTDMDFVLKLSPLLAKLKTKVSTKMQIYTIDKEYVTINTEDILFVDSSSHYVTYHTEAKEYVVREPLSSVEAKLGGKGFFRISNWYIVNLKNIDSATNDTVLLGGTSLSLSRRKKKAFLEVFTKYYGI